MAPVGAFGFLWHLELRFHSVDPVLVGSMEDDEFLRIPS